MPAIQPVAATIVLAARQFNPSITSQVWMIRNQVFDESDLRKGCLFTDAFANVNTKHFNLLISPEQVQVAFGVQEGVASIAKKAISQIAKALPETPYTAIGLNFVFHLVPQPESTVDLSQQLFFNTHVKIHNEFDVPDARFGAYMSKDWRNSRIKLDVKPMRVEVQGSQKELDIVQFAFNFHRDLNVSDEETSRPTQIDDHLSLWEDAQSESLRVITSGTEGLADEDVLS